jgi:ATP-dependent RNA helicase RhlE
MIPLSFTELLLSDPILRAVVSEGYTVATPIQAQAIPHLLNGRDVLGCAQTGTGKTAAFALPILHRLSIVARPAGVAKPRCLVLCPTRELAGQIAGSFRVYGKHVGLSCGVVYGGVGIGPQAQMLRRGCDILIATPGRLLDLLGQRLVDLRSVEILVLDEADRMLDMGFIIDIRKIIAGLTARRQTMLFSATMPNEIRKLASAILRDPATVQLAAASNTADRIEQSVYFVGRSDKPDLLAHLVNELPMSRAIVFTRTKHGADRLVRRLHNSGIRAEAIHGNKSQNARQRALENFRAGKIALLVATDVASRGIDVDGISHVVNYDLTDEPETYVHRIGRTARAGAAGAAVAFCDPEEMPNLKAIERLLRKQIPVKKAKFTATGATGHNSTEHRAPEHRASEHRAHEHRSAERGHTGHGQRRDNRHPRPFQAEAPHANHAAVPHPKPQHPQHHVRPHPQPHPAAGKSSHSNQPHRQFTGHPTGVIRRKNRGALQGV